MIKLLNITKKFGDKTVLDSITVEFPETGLVIIKGANGSGKSTLLNIIGTIDLPTTGEILVDNECISDKSENFLTKYREKYVGFIFQNNNLFDNMTVEENLCITNKCDNIEQVIDILDIKNIINKKVKQLSGGEQQRVAIGRALLKNPRIILADEPTSSIDYNTKSIIMELLEKISKTRLVIVVSHDADIIKEYGNVIITLSNGKVVEHRINTLPDSKNDYKILKNNFDFKNFTFKNLFDNKKRLLRNGFILLLSFILVLLTTSISSVNYVDMHAETMKLENDDLIIFNKNKEYQNSGVFLEKEFDLDDIKHLEKMKITKNTLEISRCIYIGNSPLNFNIDYSSQLSVPVYYRAIIPKLYFFDYSFLGSVNYGRYPIKNNEIVISSYLADQIIMFGVATKNNVDFHPKNYDEIINYNNELELGNHTVKIVGVYQQKYDKYYKLKESYSNIGNEVDIFYETVRNNAGDVYVNDKFFDLYSDIPNYINQSSSFSPQKNPNVNGGYSIYSLDRIKIFNTPVGIINGEIINKLNRNEIIINREMLEKEKFDIADCIGKKINIYIRNFSFGDRTTKTLELVIVGVSSDDYAYFNEQDLVGYINESTKIEKIRIHEKNTETIKQILTKFPIINHDITTRTNFSQKYAELKQDCTNLAKLFLIISLIFIILSVIYTKNYIFNSVDMHTKDIAILKSLGVSNPRILQAFFLEISIITFATYIIALFSFFLIRFYINYILSNIVMFKINIVPFELKLVIIIILSAFLINLIISILVFHKIKRTSPQALLKSFYI